MQVGVVGEGNSGHKASNPQGFIFKGTMCDDHSNRQEEQN